MTTDNFQRLLQTLKAEEIELRRRLEPLTAEWRHKKEQIAAVERALFLLGTKPSDVSLNGASPLEGNSNRPADVAYRVLSEANEPLHYHRLLSTMEATGFTMPGTNPSANLLAHLSRDERIARVDKGVYALREWNLREAVRKGKSKKPSSRRRR